jgi:hypothetical protein
MAQAMTEQELRRRAISRALANGGAEAVTRVRYGLYQVRSATRPGQQHTVCTDHGEWRCSCEAGLAGRPACWHRAALYIARVEQGGGRVTGPSTQAAGGVPANVTPLQRRAA